MSWLVESYQDVRGRVPVNLALLSLAVNDQARVLLVIELLVDYGPTLKMPHARHLQGKLSELRMDGRPNSYRILSRSRKGLSMVYLVPAKETNHHAQAQGQA